MTESDEKIISEKNAPSPRMGIVIPLANEEETVKAFLERVRDQISKNDRIFCIVDKASTDHTLDKVKQASQADDRIIPIWAPESRCVVDAYFRGYREALKAKCRWILEMDGGMSHKPEEIPRFIEAMDRGIDFAAGSRFVPGGSHIGQLSRKLVSKGGTILANWLLKTKMKDMTSGFECFTHKAMSFVVENGVRSRAHFFQTEIRYQLRDWNWLEVPITYTNPSKRMGKSSLLEAFRNLWQLYREAKRKAG